MRIDRLPLIDVDDVARFKPGCFGGRAWIDARHDGRLVLARSRRKPCISPREA